MLQEKFKNYKILLASQSSRRQELLKGLGVDFEIIHINIDESYPPNLEKEKITEFISLSKANAIPNIKQNEILITADTLVWLNGEILGKPIDKKHSFQMIEKMSGKIHEVFTSITIKSPSKTVTFSDTTKVEFDEFTEQEIHYYINNYHPFDKAGSYGIQDWLGFAKIKCINGSFYNVMGLPLQKLYRQLENF